MNRNSLFIFLIGIGFAANANAASDVKYVTGLESTSVRETPSFFAKVTNSLPYGTSVQVVQKKSTWAQIKFAPAGQTAMINGWIPLASFARQDGVLREIGRGQAAAENDYKDDVMAAGKGFSAEFEAQYKKENPSANFAEVDQLEKRQVAGSDLLKFAEDGELHGSALPNGEVKK